MKDVTKMKTLFKSIAGASLALGFLVGPANAAGDNRLPAENYSFSYEGIFGKFDRGQLQRGFLVFKEKCASCHGLKRLAFRNLAEKGGPEFTAEQVKAIAAEYEVPGDPDEDGEVNPRPAKPFDRFPSPFENENAARASNNGAYPPDLSLMTKARTGWHGSLLTLYTTTLFKGNGGPEYVASLIARYGEDKRPACMGPEGEGGYYNPYYAAGGYPEACKDKNGNPTVKGSLIAMPPPLSGDDVEYGDGTKATIEQQAKDVAAFLTWVAEPKMEERKRIGLAALLFMGLFTVLLYMSKKMLWRSVDH